MILNNSLISIQCTEVVLPVRFRAFSTFDMQTIYMSFHDTTANCSEFAKAALQGFAF